ncbi:unnamed protein product [Phyllotreta striolata]|uniref:4-coumarate--CoA ligase n=1 Tax=Phyllotreta striolata TaxID=444603 RepID=A0A9N9TWN1_PHYSR|nr:unnamed protein product [Phyllotreta striolata]
MSLLRKIASKRLLSPVAGARRSAFQRGNATGIRNGIVSSGLEDVVVPEIPIVDYVFENIGKWEHLVAAECGVTGRKYTYGQVRTKTKNFGAALRRKFKLEKGDVVAIVLPNVPEFPIVTLGALRAGLICTTVNPIYTPDEVSRQLTDSSAKVIITLNELWPLANAAANLAKKNIPIITINSQVNQATPQGAANFSELADADNDIPATSISSEDLAFLPYSSGTTGLPKGVQLTHANIVTNSVQIDHPEVKFSLTSTPDHQDICNGVLPLFHIYGFTVLCMFQLRIGARLITLPKFTPEYYVGSLKKHKPHMLYVAPPIAIFLSKFPHLTSEDFASVRGIVNGAASLGPLDSQKLIEKIKRDVPILQGYGLTETSPAVSTTRLNDYNKPECIGSIGRPVPNTVVKIVNPDDPAGGALGPNELGELLVKGPQVMKGYFHRPEENEKAFADGWFRTGDMMYYNEQGFLFVKDRLKELIKVKGFQVAPAELEEIIRDFPDVIDAAVIGIPHEAYGECPRAYVVPRPNTKIDVQKLNDYVNSKVANYKQLKGGVNVVESIPKNPSGKILRRQLKLMYEKEKK